MVKSYVCSEAVVSRRKVANMAAVVAINRNRRPRVFQKRVDLGEMIDSEVISRYRISREGIQTLVEVLTPRLERHTRRTSAIPVLTQVCFNVVSLTISFKTFARCSCALHIYFILKGRQCPWIVIQLRDTTTADPIDNVKAIVDFTWTIIKR